MSFWDSIKSFFANLGHTIMADIITALPQAKQDILEAFSVLIDAAIMYIESKYGSNANVSALSPEAKLNLDNQKRSEAIQYVKTEAAKGVYPAISDSLLNFGIESRYQLKVTNSEGNHGNFPGGNSNGA